METKATQGAVLAPSGLRAMPTASGHSVLLANEDFALYHLHITRFMTDLRPEGQTETELVQRLADTEWRLNRLTRIEMGIYARGHVEFSGLFCNEDPDIQSLLIEQHILCAYSRDLKGLASQESRLRRYAADDLARLQCLQTSRREKEDNAATAAIIERQPYSVQAVEAEPIMTSETLLRAFDFTSDADCASSTPLHSRRALAGHKTPRKGNREAWKH